MTTTLQSSEWNGVASGDRIGNFRLMGSKPIGRGGFGEVWRAQEELAGNSVGQPCAVKLLRFQGKESEPSTHDWLKATWIQEIKALKSLTHDAIPRTVEGGFDEQTKLAFIAMELLEGETLARRIARKRVGWRRALLIAEQVASALDEAHRHDVVHRDLKPQNVFLCSDGRVCVIDWGIARLGKGPVEPIAMPERLATQAADNMVTIDIPTREQEDLAKKNILKNLQRAQQIVGTAGYIAPEVYEGVEPTAYVDAYALGVVLYQCITGKLPYALEDVHALSGSAGSAVDAQRAMTAALWEATVAQKLVPIEAYVPDVPIAVCTLVYELLSRDPEARHARQLAKRVAHASRFPYGVPETPYAGLDAFGAERASFLFGRDAHVQRIVKRLEHQRALVLSGPSGCGKSSLAVAGVAARMDRELLEGTDGWRLFVVRPSQPKALELVLPSTTNAVDPQAAPLGTVVVVDQLEEVLTLDGERQHLFCEALAELVAPTRAHDVLVSDHMRITREMPIRVLATVREDFEWQVVRIEALRDFCETSRCLVTGVDATSARELVEEPAKALGYRVGDGVNVVEEVEAALAKDPTALPIVQFALTEWWARRDEATKELPAKAWRELGGVEGALSSVADRHYRNLSDADQKSLRDLFGRLLLGDRKQWVSAQSLGNEKERQLMEKLAILRLVKRRDEAESGAGYELAHESLAKRWDILKQWTIERAVEDALIVDLTAEAQLWVRKGMTSNRLRLDVAVPVAVRKRLDAQALAYVDASMTAKRAAEKAELSARRQRYGVTIVALSIIVAALTGYAVQIGNKEAETRKALDMANDEKRKADAAEENARKERDRAIEAEKEAYELAEREKNARIMVEIERNQRIAALEDLEQKLTRSKNNVKGLEKIAEAVAERRKGPITGRKSSNKIYEGSAFEDF